MPNEGFVPVEVNNESVPAPTEGFVKYKPEEKPITGAGGSFSEGFVPVEIYNGQVRPVPDDSDLRAYADKNLVLRQGKEPSFWEKVKRRFLEPTPEDRRAQAAIDLEKAEKLGLQPHETETRTLLESRIGEALASGYDLSVTGLMDYHDPDVLKKAQKFQQGMNPLERFLSQASTLYGDSPAMIAGAAIGGYSGGPAGAVGGAFALPAGLRKIYIDKIEKGDVLTFKDFWKRLTDATIETGKGYVTGVATKGVGGAAGKVAGRLAITPAEVTTMVTVGAVLDGKVPEPQDFLDAAMVIVAMHAVTGMTSRIAEPKPKLTKTVKENLQKIYAETGMPPKEVLKLVKKIPELKAHLETHVEGDIPKPFRGLRPKKAHEMSKQEFMDQLGETKERVVVDETEPHDITPKAKEVTLPAEDKVLYKYIPKRDVETIKEKGVSEEGALKEVSPKIYEEKSKTVEEPTEGEVIVRIEEGKRPLDQEFQQETGVFDKTEPDNVPAKNVEVLTENGWKPLTDVETPVATEHEVLVKEQLKINPDRVPENVVREYENRDWAAKELEDRVTRIPPPEEVLKKAEDFEAEDRIAGYEKGFNEASKLPETKYSQRVKDKFIEFGHKISREYEHLPKTGFFATARFELLKLAKQREIADAKTIDALISITSKLSPKEFKLFNHKVVLDDLMETYVNSPESVYHDLFTEGGLVKEKLPDGTEVVKKESTIPFFKNKDELIMEHGILTNKVNQSPEILKALKRRREIWDALRREYVPVMKSIGIDLSDKLTRQNYFRHRIIDRMESNYEGKGMGKKFRSVKRRGFLKQRKGSELPFITDYYTAESEVMSKMLYDIEAAKARRIIEKNYDISADVKEAWRKAQDPTKTWEDFIPEGYEVYQMDPGHSFYIAETSKSRMAVENVTSKLEDIGVDKKLINKVLAMGAKNKEIVIPSELAVTLDNLSDYKKPNWHKELLKKWKVWQLMNPKRVVKYNLRNISGDLDATIFGNTKTLLRIPEAVRQMVKYAKNGILSDDYAEFVNRGGRQLTLQVQEMEHIHLLAEHLNKIKKQRGLKRFNIVRRGWNTYWKNIRGATEFREGILRFAAYLEFKKEMAADLKNGGVGRPKTFAMSIPEEIMGLKDIRDRAFWLSNDMLGAYDRVSVAGQAMREHLIPFWSFQETNFRRYKQAFKNAARDQQLSEAVGRKLLGSAVRLPGRAMRVGKAAIKLMAFWGMLEVWNNSMYPDEEKKLPEHVRTRPHIIYGVDEKTGEIHYFSRLGAFVGDFGEWFGFDQPVKYVREFMNGDLTVKEVAKEIGKSSANKFVQGLEPVSKLFFETITRRTLYPDLFEPGTIRDRLQYIAKSLSLEDEYNAIAGKPSRPYKDTLMNIATYKVDPGEAAYMDIMSLKKKFTKKYGKDFEGFLITRKGNAFYNLRSAVRLGDRDAIKKYFNEYIELGGTNLSTRLLVKRFDPLYGLSKADKELFISELSREDKIRLLLAYDYYFQLFVPGEK